MKGTYLVLDFLRNFPEDFRNDWINTEEHYVEPVKLDAHWMIELTWSICNAILNQSDAS